jgi:hypothetical protein
MSDKIQTRKSFLLKLADLLDEYHVNIDLFSEIDSIAFELDCGGSWIVLPEAERFTPDEIRDIANSCAI